MLDSFPPLSAKPPLALIFDCDGTLVDTMPLHFRAWQQVAPRHGLHFPEDRFYALGGVPSRDIARILAAEQGVTLDPLAVAREKEAAYLEQLDDITPIPEIVAIAREHHGKIPLAVATGGSHRVVEQVLARLGLRSLFAVIVTSEDVTRQKPAPDIFLEAARRLGVPPERCRAYEDTDLGLQAIRAAGMEAVDVRALLSHLRKAGQPLPDLR
ncbi:MAG: beta-phosphoglucomutase family hydrolase [Verrucomicrobiae bacterium]|nr:beta-phosphoglucomutase family hydrolase [Verrucomicrobiae bacterium]MDW8308927.1 beta-phosphoglucomutase family hydrolase [Verrucomicrobiales bacterium]